MADVPPSAQPSSSALTPIGRSASGMLTPPARLRPSIRPARGANRCRLSMRSTVSARTAPCASTNTVITGRSMLFVACQAGGSDSSIFQMIALRRPRRPRRICLKGALKEFGFSVGSGWIRSGRQARPDVIPVPYRRHIPPALPSEGSGSRAAPERPAGYGPCLLPVLSELRPISFVWSPGSDCGSCARRGTYTMRDGTYNLPDTRYSSLRRILRLSEGKHGRRLYLGACRGTSGELMSVSYDPLYSERQRTLFSGQRTFQALPVVCL
jgi:hypothetical protein